MSDSKPATLPPEVLEAARSVDAMFVRVLLRTLRVPAGERDGQAPDLAGMILRQRARNAYAE